MHDIYRSIYSNKNANVLFTKSTNECEQAQHMQVQIMQIGYIYFTGNKKLSAS